MIVESKTILGLGPRRTFGAVFLKGPVVVVSMGDLAGANRLIAVASEILGKELAIEELFVLVHQPSGLLIDACCIWIEPGEQGGAGWPADRGLAVGIGEESASVCEPINIRDMHLGMSFETTNPVIEIIDGNKENVAVILFCR